MAEPARAIADSRSGTASDRRDAAETHPFQLRDASFQPDAAFRERRQQGSQPCPSVHRPVQVVTGAYGYSGKYVAARLLEAGYQVRTLTNSPMRANPFAGRVPAAPLAFDRPDELADALQDADVLYNTYWTRFDHDDPGFTRAVANTSRLFAAARAAGVRRIVHVSITNASTDASIPCFRAKARVERELASLGVSFAIVRPAVLFGHEDLLLNNLAWMLRHFSVIGICGDGNYKVRPIHVDDLAALCLDLGRTDASTVVDAVGPETYAFRDLVNRIGAAIGIRRRMLSVPLPAALAVAKSMRPVLKDMLVTRDEVEGLMSGLLCTDSASTGVRSLSAWIVAHADRLGLRYAGDAARRRDRLNAYAAL